MILTTHLFSVDRTTLQSWCKTGILFFLAIYISQIPFPRGNASVKSLSLAVVAALWLARMFLEKRFYFHTTRLWWPLIIFTSITLLSVIGSIDVGYSVKNIKKYTFTSVFLFFTVVNNVEGMRDVKTLLLALMVATGVFSILALIDHLMFEPSFGSRLSFHYLDRNLNRFSKFYDIVVPINLAMVWVTKNQIKKLIFMCVFMLSLATIFLMQTRASYIVIFLGLLVIMFVYRKKLFIFMLAVPLVTAFLMPTNMTSRAKEMVNFESYLRSGGVLHYRIDAWKGALRIISKHPLLGLGVGKSNYGKTAREFQDLTIPYDHAHNTYLQIAVELGLVGLAVFLWLFGSVFYHGFKSYMSLPNMDEKAILIFGIICGIGSLFVHGTVTSFYKNEAFFLLWFSVALLFVLTENSKFQMQNIANSENFVGCNP